MWEKLRGAAEVILKVNQWIDQPDNEILSLWEKAQSRVEIGKIVPLKRLNYMHKETDIDYCRDNVLYLHFNKKPIAAGS